MTKHLEITPEAERDISAITLNVLQQTSSVEAAKNVALEFNNQLLSILSLPDQGRALASDETREVVLTGLPYIAVFKVNVNAITIVRVLYGACEK